LYIVYSLHLYHRQPINLEASSCEQFSTKRENNEKDVLRFFNILFRVDTKNNFWELLAFTICFTEEINCFHELSFNHEAD